MSLKLAISATLHFWLEKENDCLGKNELCSGKKEWRASPVHKDDIDTGAALLTHYNHLGNHRGHLYTPVAKQRCEAPKIARAEGFAIFALETKRYRVTGAFNSDAAWQGGKSLVLGV